MPFYSSTGAVPPLPTAVNRLPQAPNWRKLHPKLLQAARLQAASTQHMSQSKQIAWNLPEHAEGPLVPKSLFLSYRAACGEGNVLWERAGCSPQGPNLQLCRWLFRGAADPPHCKQGCAGMESWKIMEGALLARPPGTSGNDWGCMESYLRR